MKHTISVLVENKFGVLARISGLFSARGYNINSLSVSETHDPTMSCMTIVIDAADERILEQIKKQLNRLIDVITVSDLTKKEHVERELMLVKVAVKAKDKPKVKQLARKFNAVISGTKNDCIILDITAEQGRIDAFLNALKGFKISELVRTGKIAMVK